MMMLKLWVFLAFCTAFALCLPRDSHFNYKEVIRLSLLFYKAQRSGRLGADKEVPWRGDSALEDRGENGEDLTGGYYDASDFVKFGFTMAFTTTVLSWGLLVYREAYEKAGQYNQVLDAIKWSSDYFLKCHVSPYEFYGQVGDFSIDHKFWGRPEDMNMTRPAYKITKEHPGSDLAGETAAALAATSLVFKERNSTYSQEVLRHALELYNFAVEFRGLYHEAIPGAKIYYESTGYGDELTWAAVWMYKATKDNKYIEQAENFYNSYRLKERPNEFFYNKKVAGVQVLLANLTQRKEYLDAVKSFCDYTVDEQKRTPKGLVFIEKFGTLSHASNVAFICLQAAELNISTVKYIEFARSQIDYVLGSTGISFLIGFGEQYPLRPHHSASSCPNLPAPCGWDEFRSKDPNPQILYGALVSGPDQNDHYEDVRQEFLYNEVTIDYNAGFQSTVAGLLHHVDNTD